MLRKLLLITGIIMIFISEQSVFSKNLKKDKISYMPAFVNFPALNVEPNKINQINFEDFMLIPASSISSVDFTKFDKNYMSNILYDVSTGKLYITALDKEGVSPVTFLAKYGDNEIEQTFFVNIKKSVFFHTLKYKSSETVSSVSVVGDFNGWNSNALLMKKNGEGYFSADMELKSGTYRYKFVVNGNQWIKDDLNPDSSPDGFGGYNSILTLGSSSESNLDIISAGKSLTADSGVMMNFLISGYNPDSVKKVKTYILINNRIINEIEELTRNNLEIYIDKNNLEKSISSQASNHYSKLNIMLVAEKSYFNKTYQLNHSNKIFNWKDSILYFLFSDRFYNFKNKADFRIKDKELAVRANYLGGNYNGISKKIEDRYFTKLGINSIWISPVNENPDVPYLDSLPPHRKFSGYHGYWPVDSYKIEKNFGTLADLKKMVDVAHRHNIKIMIDFVANHVHEEHPLYKEHSEYFGILNLPDGRKNIRLFDEYPLTTWFDDFLPSFDYSNPKSVDYMVDNALWLIKETGIDGFRLDAVKHIDHIFWKKLKQRIKLEIEIPSQKVFYMVGESISDRDKIMEYVNPGEINGQFDFPLYWDIRDIFAAGLDGFTRLNKSFTDSLKIYGTDAIMSNILGNHDFSRFMAYADEEFSTSGTDEKEYGWKHRVKVDNPENYKKLTLAFAFLATVPGVPLIYYGDEFGMTGAHDPDNRRMMRFDKELSKPEKSVLRYVSKLNKIRKANPVFRYGDFIPLIVEKEYYVYMLSYFNDKAVVALSRNSEELININLPEWVNMKKLKNAMTGVNIPLKNNRIQLKLTKQNAVIMLGK